MYQIPWLFWRFRAAPPSRHWLARGSVYFHPSTMAPAVSKQMQPLQLWVVGDSTVAFVESGGSEPYIAPLQPQPHPHPISPIAPHAHHNLNPPVPTQPRVASERSLPSGLRWDRAVIGVWDRVGTGVGEGRCRFHTPRYLQQFGPLLDGCSGWMKAGFSRQALDTLWGAHGVTVLAESGARLGPHANWIYASGQWQRRQVAGRTEPSRAAS